MWIFFHDKSSYSKSMLGANVKMLKVKCKDLIQIFTKGVPASICKAATLNAWKGDKEKQQTKCQRTIQTLAQWSQSSTCAEGRITGRQTHRIHNSLSGHRTAEKQTFGLSPRAGWLLYRTSMMDWVFFITRTRHLTPHQKYSTNLRTPPTERRNSDWIIKNVREGINVCMH